jgi:serine/threonine protein phosphatase PrpC
MGRSTTANGVVIDIAELSDPGRDPSKQINEDSAGSAVTAFGHLAVVCDGMGGHSGGQNASRTAVSHVLEAVRGADPSASPREVLKSAIELAGRAVFTLGGSAPNEVRPGSTCVAVLLIGREALIAHVGDSRAYLVREGHVQRLTRDHSLVEDMVDAGVISRAEAAGHPDANKITRALGIQPHVQVEQSSILVATGDLVLLATDGLSDLVADGDISKLTAAHAEPNLLCQELVGLANQRGGFDNITVVALRVLELPLGDETSSPTWTDALDPSGASNRTLLGGAPAQAAAAAGVDVERARVVRPTVPDTQPTPARPEPQRTLVDEGTTERLTEPGLHSGGERLAASAQSAQIRAARRTSLLIAVSAILAGLVVGGVVVWWIIGALRSSSSEDAPPLPLEPAPVVLEASTVLEPDIDGETETRRPGKSTLAWDAAAEGGS